MLIIKEQIVSATQQLTGLSDSAQLDAELILAFVLKQSRSHLHAWPEKSISNDEHSQFKNMIQRRLNGEPVAHILGERGFWSLNLKVTKDTLIPRPDTERLVELALEHIPEKSKWKILDLGTGTGAIALSLAKECSTSLITATDQSLAALDVTKQNALDNKIQNIEFIQSNWFSELENQQFNIIVTNPPYIRDNDPHLQQGDVRFEPLSALTAGEDGLDDIRAIIKDSQKYLSEEGVLLIEHGYDQADAVCDLLSKTGFSNVCNFKDYNNNPRVSIGILKNSSL